MKGNKMVCIKCGLLGWERIKTVKGHKYKLHLYFFTFLKLKLLMGFIRTDNNYYLENED